MDPFGNFGWSFGFGFGWILIGVFAILMILAIVQLARSSFRDDRRRSGEQAALNSLTTKEAELTKQLNKLVALLDTMELDELKLKMAVRPSPGRTTTSHTPASRLRASRTRRP